MRIGHDFPNYSTTTSTYDILLLRRERFHIGKKVESLVLVTMGSYDFVNEAIGFNKEYSATTCRMRRMDNDVHASIEV